MAYDEQRTFAGAQPALHNVGNVEHDGRRLYRREQSIGFQYMNPPSFGALPSGPVRMPGPSRRPLPTPRNRPESMPPPPRHAPLVVQAPAPSRPAILAPVPSPTPALSPTAPPARRPLPMPSLASARPSAKHTSVDLAARPASPLKSTLSAANANLDRDLCIPSSFSRRTTPLPGVDQRSNVPLAAPLSNLPPTWPRASHSEVHETQPSKPTPLWTRNYPATSSAQIAASVIERRSTVSGTLPPILRSPPPPQPSRRTESPERAQPAQRTQLSPSRRPLPSSPTEPPQIPFLQHHILASSEDDLEPSSPSDISLSDDDTYQPMTFAVPTQAEDSDQEEEIVFARNTPSPQYGIRDLPTRSRVAIANRDDSQNASTTVAENQQAQAAPARAVRSTPLPQPPPSSSGTPQSHCQTTDVPQSPRVSTSPPVSSTFKSFSDRTPLSSPTAEPQSLTLRFASMGLAEERERERKKQVQQQVSSPTRSRSLVRAVPDPTSPVRQHQGWPANVPPLPRAPGTTTRPFFGTVDVSTVKSQPSKSNGISSPSPASLPTSPTHPARSFPSSPNLNIAFDRGSSAQQPPHPPPNLQKIPQLSERQLQKQRARDPDIDLDDAPPPSLRRSPSPIRQGFTQAAAVGTMNDTPPRRQWTPGHDVVSRTGNQNGSGTSSSYAGFRAGSQSPERGGQPPIQSLIQSLSQPQHTTVPRISLLDEHHDSDVEDDAPGRSIVLSGPGSGPSASVSAQHTPAISVSEPPRITVLEDEAPTISVSAADSSFVTFSPPKVAVSDSAQSQRPGSSSGGFGSRHTQFQESSPSHPVLGRGPSSKRGLPPPPSLSNPMRTNGLSCGGCNGPIVGRIVSAMCQRWHPHCFRCSICNELLEHVSSYEHDGKPYCHLDYHEAFAPRCFHCKTAIIDERFITLDDPALGKRTYHEQHFFCAECGDPFLAPSGPLPSSVARTGELSFAGDGEFVDDDVGFTVYKGHPYCEACHVRLRMPKCKACKKSIRDGIRAVEALGGKWCWGCFVCEGCKKPFEDPTFFSRDEKPFCEPCFSLILRNEV